MAPRRPEALIGREIAGQFRLDRYLGRGRSTLVFAAADLATGDEVAIKLLASTLTADVGFMRRFRHVLRAASAMEHPNVARVLAWGEERELFVVTELMAGPLRSVMGPGGGLSVGQAAAMAVDASRGLSFLAQRNLVHRRLHPSNLLISPEGKVVVADAGLSWILAHQSGHQFSDFRYLAPEAGSGTTGAPIDVYALGLVMFETLCGDLPMLAGDVNATLGMRHDRDVVVEPGWGRVGKAIAAAGRADPGRRVPAAQLDVGLMALIDQLGSSDVSLPRVEPGAHSDELEAMRLIVRSRVPAVAPTPPPTPPPAPPATPSPAPPATPSPAPPATPSPALPATPSPAPPATPSPAAAPAQQLGGDAHADDDVEDAKGTPGGVGVALNRLLVRWRLAVPRGQGKEGDDPNAPTAEEAASRRIWVFGLLGVVAVVVILIFGVQRLVLASAGTVPNLVGANVEEARDVAAEQRWRLNVAEVRRDGTDVDEILSQSPDEGTKLEAGEAVDVTVSLGQTLVDLPDLDGLDQDEAEAIIAFAGMKLGTVTNTYDAKTRSGIVLSHTAPEEDGQVPKGSTVDLVISDGARPRQVPENLEGKNALAVAKALEAVALKPVIEKVQDPSVPFGFVVSVEPASGTEVEFESEVKVRVSSPRDKAVVPDVTGKSTLQADADLRAAGLNVLGIQGSAGSPVVRTIPAAGEEVSQGTAVRLVTE